MNHANPYAAPMAESYAASLPFTLPGSTSDRLSFGSVMSQISIVFSLMLMGGLLIYQLFFNDEWDQLLEVMLGSVGLGAVCFAAWFGRWRKKKLAAHVSAGIQLTNDEQWEAALSEFDSALSICGSEVHSHYGRGLCLLVLRRFKPAVDALDAAISLGVHNSQALRFRAQALMELERFDRALTDFDELADRDPQDAEVICGRGFVHLKLGQLLASLEDSTAAVKLNPEGATAYNNRGVVLLELGRIPEAISDLERALEMDPEFPNPQRHLARAREMSASIASRQNTQPE